MGTPKRPTGEYIPKHNVDVVIALGDGVLPELTAIDMALVLFLARTNKGWNVSGRALTLDWVAVRLGVSRSGLDKSIARLKRLKVIDASRTLTQAHYDISDEFRKRCAEHLRVTRIIREHQLHLTVEALTEAGEPMTGELLHAVAHSYMETSLTGRALARHILGETPA